jgi:hypothetical protein
MLSFRPLFFFELAQQQGIKKGGAKNRLPRSWFQLWLGLVITPIAIVVEAEFARVAR